MKYKKEEELKRYEHLLREYLVKNGTFRVPESMHQGIVNHVIWHIPAGHFLECVFANDLIGAVGRADDLNRRYLAQYVVFFYNCDCIPADCWGSVEKVNAWLAQRKDMIEERADNEILQRSAEGESLKQTTIEGE